MRSTAMPRVELDTEVRIEPEGAPPFAAHLGNLSAGGVFVETEAALPTGNALTIYLDLRDGGAEIIAPAKVVWTRAEGSEEGARGMALRFVDLDDTSRGRINRVVSSRSREPTGRIHRPVRIHLPSLPAPLRAVARDQGPDGIMIEAELPWLKLGSPVTTELSPDRACDGRVRWVGLDVTRSGAARLRIFIDLDEAQLETPTPGVMVQPSAPEARAETPASGPAPSLKPKSRLGAWLGAAATAAVTATAMWWIVPRLQPPQAAQMPPSLESKDTPPRPVVVAIPKSRPEAPAPPSRTHKGKRRSSR